MYRIYTDNELIYDSTLEDYVITKGVIEKEVNKFGSFVFGVTTDNPYYDRIKKLKSIIKVRKRDEIVFRGRVFTSNDDFYNNRVFTCEGDLAFLRDSIQRPYEFTGSPADLFRQFITNHNEQVDPEKQFIIGQITVTDTNDYINRSNSNYDDTFTNFSEHLLKTHGGYIHVTYNENEEAVINWFADFPYESGQVIEFGENLLDYVKTNSAENVATAIIPLGAKIEPETPETEDETTEPTETTETLERRVTIASVNNGVDYIYDATAVEVYGWIFATVTWDDVTLPENLLKKAQAELRKIINQNITIELNAIDLSVMSSNIDSFRFGAYTRILSKPHKVDERLLLEKQSIDLLKPDNDKITLGYTLSTFTDSSANNAHNSESIIKQIEIIESNYALNDVVSEAVETLRSAINQTSTSITTEVSENYVTKDGLDSELSTKFTQLNDSFLFEFTQLKTVVDDNDSNTKGQIEEIKSFIHLDNGDVVLGKTNDNITLRLKNNRVSIVEGTNEVAYFSNNKLYITDAEILASLRIGNFSFIPRSNGNLSFKKVGG